MKINFLGKFPNGYPPYGKLAELDEYDLKELAEHNLDEVWYWYSTATWEGSGQILMRKGDLYDVRDAGHCSDYGPCERIKFNGQTLADLYKSFNKEYMQSELVELFQLAGFSE
jgi:hypothetical protein